MRRRPAPDGEDVLAPQARRTEVAGWRDPRLLAGVLVVASCVVLGSLVFSRADDTVRVWGVRRDLPTGTELSADDLEPRQVRLADGGEARYLPVDGADGVDPDGRTLARATGAGELLPAAALADHGARAGVAVPLVVGVHDLPPSVVPGSVVDVWVAPAAAVGSGAGAAEPARRVLTGVPVVALVGGSDALAPDTTRSVTVRVGDPVDVRVLGELLGLAATGRVLLTHDGTSR